MTKIVQAESVEVRRSTDPLPDLLQADERLPGDPARKYEGVSCRLRQCAQRVQRGQSDRDVPSTNLAVGQAKDAADEIDLLPFQAKGLAFAATREAEKSDRSKRKRVGAVRLHICERLAESAKLVHCGIAAPLRPPQLDPERWVV